MIELLIPWAVCLLFMIVAIGIFLDSRYTEKQIDKEWDAIFAIREQMIQREASAQRIVREATARVDEYLIALNMREEQLEEANDKIGDLNEILLSYRRREQRG